MWTNLVKTFKKKYLALYMQMLFAEHFNVKINKIPDCFLSKFEPLFLIITGCEKENSVQGISPSIMPVAIVL
jgi:hypothetical protein